MKPVVQEELFGCGIASVATLAGVTYKQAQYREKPEAGLVTLRHAPGSARGLRRRHLRAVATAIGIELRDGTVRAEGDLDFRCTLGVSKDVPVGFQRIRLHFDLDADVSDEQLATLLRLTERYCVVYQTLRGPADIEVSCGGTKSGR